MNFEALRELRRKALGFALENGTEVQSEDMTGVVAVLSQTSEELEDLTTGKRNTKDHPHHKIEDLQESVNGGRRAIGEICREIVANKKK